MQPSPSHAPPAASAIAALRHATRERHERIEGLMDLRRLRDADRYGRVLRAFDAFLGRWEPALVAALPASLRPWALRRSRRPFLARDLAALGLPPLRGPVPIVRMDDAAAAFGSMYVLEGSALGGQAIARELAREGMGPDAGCAWFHGWGPETAALWRDFRSQLEAHAGASPESRAAACAAACATFDALHALLQSVLHECPALA